MTVSLFMSRSPGSSVVLAEVRLTGLGRAPALRHRRAAMHDRRAVRHGTERLAVAQRIQRHGHDRACREVVGRHALLRDPGGRRSEEHTSELQSQSNLVCRLLLEKKKKIRD